MNQIPVETGYIIAALLGLGGAAVFALMGPMARVLWAVVKFPAFIIYDLVDNDHSLSENWRVFYRKKPTELHPVHGWIDTKCGLLEARHNTRIAALEERMDAVEAGPKSHQTATGTAIQEEQERLRIGAALRDYFPVYDNDTPVAPYRLSGVGAGFHPYAAHSGYFTSGIGSDASGKPCPKPTKDLRQGGGSGYYAQALGEVAPDSPYCGYNVAKAGKPCPKPTKDLRPGDEVALRAVVRTVYKDGIEFEDPDMQLWMARYSLKDTDSLRADNK